MRRSRDRTSRPSVFALLKQGESALRESWSEDDLNALAAEEPDVFDRKSGRLLGDQDKFLDAVAKAISAFANSGGGSLILGVRDDGVPDGLPTHVGRASMRDWIEQKIPHLLDYPISLFRVHTVIKSNNSKIPDDKVVIVVDVGDSPAAPHQSKRDKIYYHRVGGRSKPAQHFYIELLRQRLTAATLSFSLIGIRNEEITEHDGGLFYEAKLLFKIENIGRTAAYHWQLSSRTMTHPDMDYLRNRASCYYFGTQNFPLRRSRTSNMYVNQVILPGCSWTHEHDLGVQIYPQGRRVQHFSGALSRMLRDLTISFQLATENSPGEPIEIPLANHINIESIVHIARQKCPGFFEMEP